VVNVVVMELNTLTTKRVVVLVEVVLGALVIKNKNLWGYGNRVLVLNMEARCI
jgi:hypothetical protein